MGRFTGFYLSAVSNHLRNATNDALQPLGLNTRKLGILEHLEHATLPLSQIEISRALRMDRTTTMNLIDELVQAGWVSVGVSEDQRMQALQLSTAGRSVLRKASSVATAQEIQHLQPLDAAERGALLGYLQRVVDQLGNNRSV